MLKLICVMENEEHRTPAEEGTWSQATLSTSEMPPKHSMLPWDQSVSAFGQK